MLFLIDKIPLCAKAWVLPKPSDVVHVRRLNSSSSSMNFEDNHGRVKKFPSKYILIYFKFSISNTSMLVTFQCSHDTHKTVNNHKDIREKREHL